MMNAAPTSTQIGLSLVRSTINLDDEANARYWATVFKVSNLDLVTAVMIVGSDAKDVAAFLELFHLTRTHSLSWRGSSCTRLG